MRIPQFAAAARNTLATAFSPQTGRAMRRAVQSSLIYAGKVAGLTTPIAAVASPALAQTVTSPVEPQVTATQGVVLGLVQGLTEFIPVSSSGHLNLTHQLMGHGRELTYDVFLHLGTLAALAFYFRKEWKALFTDKSQTKLRNLIFLACIPAAITGYLLRDLEDSCALFNAPQFNALMLMGAGAIMWAADKTGRQERDLESVTLQDALTVGTSQAVALIPGVSRSGATLTAGLFLGLRRAEAARFSFLLSLPITVGAIGFEVVKLLREGHGHLNASAGAIGLGILVSAVSGFWAISFLLNYLQTKDVTPFFLWRVGVGMCVLALVFSTNHP